MDSIEFKGNWNEQKGKLKQKFVWLTDSDLLFQPGKREEMLARLRLKLGKTKEDLNKTLSGL